MLRRVAKIDVQRYNIVPSRAADPVPKRLTEPIVSFVVQNTNVSKPGRKILCYLTGLVRTAVINNYHLPPKFIGVSLQVTTNGLQIRPQDCGLIKCWQDN